MCCHIIIIIISTDLAVLVALVIAVVIVRAVAVLSPPRGVEAREVDAPPAVFRTPLRLVAALRARPAHEHTRKASERGSAVVARCSVVARAVLTIVTVLWHHRYSASSHRRRRFDLARFGSSRCVVSAAPPPSLSSGYDLRRDVTSRVRVRTATRPRAPRR